MPIVTRKSYTKSVIANPLVGQYGEIFHSRPQRNIDPYCPPSHAIIYMYLLTSKTTREVVDSVLDGADSNCHVLVEQPVDRHSSSRPLA